MNSDSPQLDSNQPVKKRKTIFLNTSDDDDRPVYISGNFNNWTTQDRRFLMKKISHGKYEFTFPEGEEFESELIYKFTKGDWSEVEIDRYGNRTPNRHWKNDKVTKTEKVAKWRKNWLPYRPSQLPIIRLISEEFEIPQLNKTRKVWALLPHDYNSSEEKYPVLYLHDAQNLFNENAEFGNWQIDKKLAVMSDYNIGKIIVIAVEHGESERLQEYNVGKTVLGIGSGKKYIRFITDTLKPFVDKTYRTKTEREFTGIGGSSMGGLVSIFSGLIYPEVFGKLMVFSPSLWVIPKIKLGFLDIFEPQETRLYLYAGGDESETMVKHVLKFRKRLLKRESLKGKMKVHLSINEDGKHNETYWSDEFPKAIEWLFFSDKED
ncbi:alpha/beta hydrolase [Algoriphagus winogradskyi]|uniref:Predicted hydrolase of the alpha/beta superfamily n=1 Tax=Algoriphagus winogradskyi TaxID=237017 RepID=A0ABY1PEV2_9BACT|nr:alpha/beta hydrolase-fold protein [Algoriphagus winogradskyi]SMP32913.1 Predicted hydrolase of the alpha/beta superfamily [Algoriphagus winogradskyi]|tara:strand:+ start:1803 stop:2933 length:1131 start_codon:yes stop_codon:yes gene_type:complete